MIIIGDGGHAKVVREVIAAMGLITTEYWGFIAVGDNVSRKRELHAHPHMQWVTLIHPSAVVSPSTKIGDGTIIMAGVVVQAGAIIGRHVILNTCCSVDHECVIEDFAHIAPGAHLCGDVIVG